MNKPEFICITCQHWTKNQNGCYGCRANRDIVKAKESGSCVVYYHKWNPEIEPYRVVWYTKQRGYYRGIDRIQVFATLDEAMEARKQMIRGFHGAEIHLAVNASTWFKNGRWEKIIGKYIHEAA